MIERFTDNWLLKRMAAVDRNILRFAAYEILFRKDIPSAVTITKHWKLPRSIPQQKLQPFLNGVLDRLAKESGKV